MSPSNLVLIGMPGSGKSTIGVLLAKRTAHEFIDTDLLIQARTGRTLQNILDEEGYLRLREIEAEVLQEIDVHNHVISTGGSAVYSDAAMQHLKKDGLLIYLDVSLAVLMQRITDFDSRGIARAPEQSFESLFEERTRLYRQYADITISEDGLDMEQVCNLVQQRIGL